MTSTDSKPTVYVVGASGRSAAESVRQAGFRAIVLDLYADRDSGDARDILPIDSHPDSIVPQLSKLKSGWVLLTGGMENYPDLVEELARYHRVLGPTAEQIKCFRDIEVLSDSISQSGQSDVLSFPETVTSLSDVGSEFGWLSKSRSGCGGFHIERMSELGASAVAPNKVYFQREILGQSIGTVFSCEQSKVHLLGVTAALTSEVHESLVGPQPVLPPMAYRGSYGVIEISNLLRIAMCSWAHSITRKLHYTGIMQADWIVDENKAWLLEINPRWTASMEVIEWAIGQNIFSIQASFDDKLKTWLSGSPATRRATDWNLPKVDWNHCRDRLSGWDNGPILPPDSSGIFHRAARVLAQPFPAKTLYKAIQYASTPIVVSREQSDEMLLNRFNRFENRDIYVSGSAGWGDIPQVGTDISAGHPIASFFRVQ